MRSVPLGFVVRPVCEAHRSAAAKLFALSADGCVPMAATEQRGFSSCHSMSVGAVYAALRCWPGRCREAKHQLTDFFVGTLLTHFLPYPAEVLMFVVLIPDSTDVEADADHRRWSFSLL